MSERLVVLDRSGMLTLYAVNGEGPELVGTLKVGALNDHTAAMVGAAFADLRAVITAGQLPTAVTDAMAEAEGYSIALPPVPHVRVVTEHKPPRPKPSFPRAARHHGSRKRDPDSLNGRVRAYLVEHGPATSAEVNAAVRAEPSASKTAAQRVSTALASLKIQGHLTRDDAGRWLVVER